MATNEDFKDALYRTILHDRALFRALVTALEARHRFEAKEKEAVSGGYARMLLTAAIHVVWELVGLDAMAEVYGDDPPTDAPREDHLMAMWWRLSLIDDIYTGVSTDASPSSLSALNGEIMSILKGDKATLLADRASVQGRPVNAWRLAQRQMAALEWEAYFRAKGTSVAEAQNAVAAAFNQTWDTIRKSKKPVIRELGPSTFDRAIRAAQRGHGFYSMVGNLSKTDDESLRHDAQAFKDERRRSLSVAGKES